MSDSSDNQVSKTETALLSWIQQFATYGVITLNKSLEIQSWNHWMETHSGKRRDEVIGKTLVSLFPELLQRNLSFPFERALRGEASVLSTALHRYLIPLPSSMKEQGVVYMRQTARITPLLSEGEVFGVVVVIEDVTQREVQAEALTRQHRRDEILSWALAHLLKSETPRNTARQLFFKIAEHLDFDTFFLYLRDIDTGSLALYTSGGIPPELEKDFSDYSFLSQLAGSPEITVFNSVQAQTAPEYDLLKKIRVSAAVAIPLLANDRKLGLLCFGTWSRAVIAKDESDLLSTIAQYLATAVDRENTHHQLQKARKELFDHAQLLEQKVIERTAKLREIIAELETFSYTIAHDLKAPLRSMVGYSQILLADFATKIPTEANVILEKLSRISKRMEILIRDLLEFSRVSRDEVVLSPVDIGPIIDDLIALRVASVRKAITVRTPLHPVRAQATLLQHVLSNLVDNAVKFIEPDRGPQITIYTEVVPHESPSLHSKQLLFSSSNSEHPEHSTANSNLAPERIRIWVDDQGIGIPHKAHRKIFGIFERGPRVEGFEGTGIGLAIVARATQRMGGTCGVESEEGKGSRFWIELPAP